MVKTGFDWDDEAGTQIRRNGDTVSNIQKKWSLKVGLNWLRTAKDEAHVLF